MAIRGVICDLDGFLVQTWKTEPLPGVVETLAELRRRGLQIAVATNQAGPLWREATGQEKYPTAEEVAKRLITCAHALGLDTWYISYFDERVLTLLTDDYRQEVLRELWYEFDTNLQEEGMAVRISARADWRKPEPGMLLAACTVWGFEPSACIYGGDLDSDRQAAQKAGMRFIETLPSVMTLLESEG